MIGPSTALARMAALSGAGGQQQAAAGVQDGAHAHGDGPGRNPAGIPAEHGGVLLQGGRGQRLLPGAGQQGGQGLVETDVTVAAQAQ